VAGSGQTPPGGGGSARFGPVHPDAGATWRELAGHRVAVDRGGHLVDPGAWHPALAQAMAAADGLALTPAHWQVIDFLRDWHGRHGRSPAMRVLVRELAPVLGAGRADSRLLYRLFPQGPAKQAARYAGLPRPASCI